MYVHYDPLVCCWLNLDPLHSPLGCRCMIMNTSGTALHYKWPVVFSAAAFDSKFISFIVRKQHLASLQSSCRLVGTSIRCKQNTTLNLNTHCGISPNQLVQNKHRNYITASKLLININFWTANWNRCYKVCVMTSYDVGHPIRWDQFRHRPQTVCREGASAIKSV